MNKLCTALMLSVLPCLVFAQSANKPKEINKLQSEKTVVQESEMKADDTLMMYPNPVKQHNKFVTIKSDKKLHQNVLVYNILGKEILKQQLKNNQLDITSLTTGVYIMKVVQEGRSVARKLVIK